MAMARQEDGTVMLSTFAPLSVNSAKHLDAYPDRPFAAAQGDTVRQLRVMRIGADKSAMGAINRPLHYPYARLPQRGVKLLLLWRHLLFLWILCLGLVVFLFGLRRVLVLLPTFLILARRLRKRG